MAFDLKKSKFTKSDVELIEDKLIYDGFFKMYAMRLRHKKFSGEWTREIRREVFHRGEASACVLYDPVNDLVGLVEQFRVGAFESELGPWCLEVVAGMIEPNENPEDLIRRELKEEAGVSDAEVIPITSYYSTPGGCSEKIYLYCALCDLSQAGGVHGVEHEDEDIYLHVLAADEVFNVMLKGRTNNAATLIGLQWLQLNRNELKSREK